MAKTSKPGACSSHTQTAKANSLKHNRRDTIPSYVNPHLTENNRTVFEDEGIRNRKSIIPLIRQAEKLYTEKTGQKCQKAFAPYRESVLVVRAGVTDQQLREFCRQTEALTGWKAVGCWLHLDEGHQRSKYVEGQEGFTLNAHAHVLWDCQDHTTGKAIKCTRRQLSQMQDVLANATGMERGNPAAETGRKHRSAQEQRIEAQEQRINALARRIMQDRVEVAQLREQLSEAKSECSTAIFERNTAKAEVEGLKNQSAELRSKLQQMLKWANSAAVWAGELMERIKQGIKVQAVEIDMARQIAAGIARLPEYMQPMAEQRWQAIRDNVSAELTYDQVMRLVQGGQVATPAGAWYVSKGYDGSFALCRPKGAISGRERSNEWVMD